MRYDLSDYGIAVKGNFALFWGGVFSNWYISPFEIDGVTFNCVEQFMMACKALTFGDDEALEKIMKTADPREQKAHGRDVKNYDDPTWKRMRYSAVTRGVFAKFDQHPKHAQVLRGTEHLIIVEASPYDNIWGIKMGSDDKFVTNPSMWKGENLLGYSLMDVRESLFSINDD